MRPLDIDTAERKKNTNPDQNSVIERLEVLDIVGVENAHKIILFQDEMVRTVEVNLGPCILGVDDLASDLPQERKNMPSTPSTTIRHNSRLVDRSGGRAESRL